VYPDSPYAVPVGSFRTPVPVPSSAPTDGTVRFVSLNCEWIPYVAGALKQLLLQTTWDTTDPTVLNRVQGQVFDLIAQFNCATAPTLNQICDSANQPVNTGIGDDCMGCCIRWNNGVLQTLSCGVWVDVPGAGAGAVGGSQQPGPGSPQPTLGQCQQYHLIVPGNGFAVLPAGYHAGDVIRLSGQGGLIYAADFLDWHIPEGPIFRAGFNTGINDSDSSAPLPDSPAGMMLIGYSPDGTFGGITDMDEAAFNTDVTITADGDPGTIYLLPNLGTLNGNTGQWSVDATLCNNSAAFIAVPVTSNTPVVVPAAIVVGNDYTINISGTAVVHNTAPINEVDGFYWTSDGWATQTPLPQPGLAGLLLNGLPATDSIPAYASDHIYNVTVTALATQMSFSFSDGEYADNSGALNVSVAPA